MGRLIGRKRMKKNKTNFKYNLNKLLKNFKTNKINTLPKHPVFGPEINKDTSLTIVNSSNLQLTPLRDNILNGELDSNTYKILFNIYFIEPKELSLNEYNAHKKEINNIIKKLNPFIYINNSSPQIKIQFPGIGVEKAKTSKGILCRQGSGKGNIIYFYYLFPSNFIFLNFYVQKYLLFSNLDKVNIFYIGVKQALKAYPYLGIVFFK